MTTETTKHTPIPWALRLGKSALYGDYYHYVGPDGERISEGRPDDQVSDANSCLIVRAVNAHAALLAACGKALDVAGLQGWRDSGGLRQEAYRALEAAIAIAEGGAE